MKEIKRIFLFIKRAEGDGTIIERVCAISEDEKHNFKFELCQTDYEESVEKLKAEFEKFCVGECGFDNSEYCEVWLLDDMSLKLDFQNDIIWWLGSVNWCCYDCVEFEFKNRSFHLKNGLSFEEFKAVNGYDESKEPFETKRIYEVFKREIDKREFDKDEIGRIVNFIKVDNYSKLFAATYKKYPMRLQLRNAFCALYHSDKAEYEKQIANVCCAVKNKITAMFSGIANIFSELPETYHETYDYDDWVAYEGDESNKDIPIYLHKYFDIIPEGMMKYIIYAMTAVQLIKGKNKEIIWELEEDCVRKEVIRIAWNTGFNFGIRHYNDEDEYNDIIAKYHDRKEESDELYDIQYKRGVLDAVSNIAEKIVLDDSKIYKVKGNDINSYEYYLKNNPDFKDDIAYEFTKSICVYACQGINKQWIETLIG